MRDTRFPCLNTVPTLWLVMATIEYGVLFENTCELTTTKGDGMDNYTTFLAC